MPDERDVVKAPVTAMAPEKWSESRAAHRIWTRGLLTLGILAILVGVEPMWDARLQSLWFDAYQRVSPRQIESTPAMVVEIDERSLAALGQWPWPRTILARLLRKIEDYQPLAIGVDILMSEADRMSPQQVLEQAQREDPVLAARLAALPSNDAELAAAIRAGPVVLGLVGIEMPDAAPKVLRATPFSVFDTARQGDLPGPAPGVGQFKGVLPSIDQLDRAAIGHGLMSMSDPAKSVIRRMPLVSSINGTLTPALTVEMLRVALHVPALGLHTSGSAVKGVTIGSFNAPTEDDGSMRIYYSPRDARRYLSAIDVLNGNVDPRDLRDKLVLVGMTGLALTDYQNTPLGEAMPGSEIHAQLLENMKDQTWLQRARWAPALEIAVFVLLGLLLIWATPRWRPRNAALLALGCVLALALAAFAGFRSQRQLFDAATPGLGLLVLFSMLLVLTLTEAARRRKSLERVVQAQREQAAVVAGELQAAQRIQTGILPRAESLQDEPRIDLAATMIPAREVGGDLYDFFRLDSNRLFFLVGDVAGKGLSASIFMAISKALYKSATLRQPDASISDLMRAANAEVSRDNPEMYFVTVFAGILDLATGELAYCNAGHEDPYLLRAAEVGFARLTEGAGPPLCTVDDFAYTTGRQVLRAGDLLCLVSDGVVDAQNGAGARYGSGRLRGVLEGMAKSDNPGDEKGSANAVVEAVLADVNLFVGTAEPADDVTVLVWRWRPGLMDRR
ncbi:MAG: CHASE2 domain-containing protein [Betaproteobacteria bacterium]